LTEAGRDGLPGEHHFYITFRTGAPGVRVSQRLRDKHPEEMTIVLQHQFWDLNVSEHAFEVGLSFSGVPERLLVPFDALTTFFDPSVQFGLKFETQEVPQEAPASEAAPAGGKALRGAGSEPNLSPAAPIALPTKIAPAGLPAVKGKAADGGTGKSAAGKSAAAKGDDGKNARADGASGEPGEAGEEAGAQVVSLDAFRKKT
jgi:hypothetical protein